MDEARGRVETAAAAAALGPAVSADTPTTLPHAPNLSERKAHCEGRLRDHGSAHIAMCLLRPFVSMESGEIPLLGLTAGPVLLKVTRKQQSGKMKG